MRICVFGAGSIGGHVAARLAAAGHEVSVVARGAHLDAIRVRGLELRFNGPQPAIRARVAASDRPADLGPQDAVFITTKANALSASAGSVAPLLGPVTPVAFVQNGIPWWYARGLRAGRPPPPDLSALDPGGALERAIGFERTIGGVVLSSNEVVEPGIVRNQTPTRNVLTLGEIDDRPSERVAALRLALRDAGMSSPDTADIRLVAWNKLLRNLSRSTLCALSGESIHDLFHADAAMQELARR
ncbi:MAG: 2-dehydropantoate 2-reductase, partial [Rhodospirillales bacterium]|nr:2-dehydropantoate 2-reductase [Rhodospirillales bacterium]